MSGLLPTDPVLLGLCGHGWLRCPHRVDIHNPLADDQAWWKRPPPASTIHP